MIFEEDLPYFKAKFDLRQWGNERSPKYGDERKQIFLSSEKTVTSVTDGWQSTTLSILQVKNFAYSFGAQAASFRLKSLIDIEL